MQAVSNVRSRSDQMQPNQNDHGDHGEYGHNTITVTVFSPTSTAGRQFTFP